MPIDKDIFQKVANESRRTDAVLLGRRILKCECGGKMAQKPDGSYECFKCGKTDIADKDKIKAALEKYGNMSALELSKITDIPRDVINAYLNDGMLMINNDRRSRCPICNTELLNGLVCPTCSKTFKSEFGGVEVKEGVKHVNRSISGTSSGGTTKNGFHYLGRHK